MVGSTSNLLTCATTQQRSGHPGQSARALSAASASQRILARAGLASFDKKRWILLLKEELLAHAAYALKAFFPSIQAVQQKRCQSGV